MGHSQGQLLELRKLVLQSIKEEDGNVEHQHQNYWKSIRQYIHSFPKYTNHYTRHYNPHKKYLPQHMSIKKMSPVKEWQYRHICNYEFNFSFHQPHSDTCNKCGFLNGFEICQDWIWTQRHAKSQNGRISRNCYLWFPQDVMNFVPQFFI
jgi:hypothetical protein